MDVRSGIDGHDFERSTAAVSQGWVRARKEPLYRRVLKRWMDVGFVLMALPLGEAGPRTSKGYALVLAVLIFVAYTNFISVSYGWIARGRLGFWEGLALPHAMALLAWIGLMRWRSRRG